MVGADRHGAARSLCRILGGRLLQVHTWRTGTGVSSRFERLSHKDTCTIVQEQDGRYCTYATNQQECVFLSRHWADIHCLWQRSSVLSNVCQRAVCALFTCCVVELATSVACKTATPRNDAEWYAPCVHRWQASCRKHVGCRRGPTACALRPANWMAPVWHEAGTLSLRHGGSGLWRTHDGQACHHCGLFTRAVGGRVATGSKCDRGADLSQKHTIKLTHRTHSM